MEWMLDLDAETLLLVPSLPWVGFGGRRPQPSWTLVASSVKPTLARLSGYAGVTWLPDDRKDWLCPVLLSPNWTMTWSPRPLISCG